MIDLDSPSPAKRVRSTPSVMNPDDLPGLAIDAEGDAFPAVGEQDDVQRALEEEMDKMEPDA